MKARVLLVTERSGGHIYPALAFAEKIKKDTSDLGEISFFSSSRLFKKLLQERGFTTVGVAFGSRFIFLELFWRAIEAVYIIWRVGPDKVIGFGGRDSFFLVLFSRILGIQAFIYEPNAKMGRANQVLSLIVKNVLRGIPPLDKKKNHKIVGIPLFGGTSPISKELARKRLNFNENPVVLCFGGSQGSSFINRIFISFIRKHAEKPYQIIHLTGKKEYKRIRDFYGAVKNNNFVCDFYQDMELLYRAADIAIARAGALTLANLSFYNLPSVIIPYPKAGGHQALNAAFLVKQKAGLVFYQDNFNFESFDACLEKLITDLDFQETIRENLEEIKLGVKSEDFSFDFFA